MTKRCHHEIETKPNCPNDYICRKCQSVWTFRNGMTEIELKTFPKEVRQFIKSSLITANELGL